MRERSECDGEPDAADACLSCGLVGIDLIGGTFSFCGCFARASDFRVGGGGGVGGSINLCTEPRAGTPLSVGVTGILTLAS